MIKLTLRSLERLPETDIGAEVAPASVVFEIELGGLQLGGRADLTLDETAELQALLMDINARLTGEVQDKLRNQLVSGVG